MAAWTRSFDDLRVVSFSEIRRAHSSVRARSTASAKAAWPSPRDRRIGAIDGEAVESVIGHRMVDRRADVSVNAR
jgi:hypothetical protein